jgi:hypothetical protein
MVPEIGFGCLKEGAAPEVDLSPVGLTQKKNIAKLSRRHHRIVYMQASSPPDGSIIELSYVDVTRLALPICCLRRKLTGIAYITAA